MKKFNFDLELSKEIVKGIVSGYKTYLYERKVKKETMNISNAYAWVRGNHIEHAVSEICEKNGLQYIKSIAGYTWGYLQFSNEGTKSLFIIKNRGALSRNISAAKKADEQNYLAELSYINEGLDLEGFTEKEKPVELKQMTLFEPIFSAVDPETLNKEIKKLKSEYKRFYIVTYEVDEAKRLSEIKLVLPKPGIKDGFLEIANWTPLLSETGVTIEDSELDAVRGEKEPEREVTFGGDMFGFEGQAKDKTAEEE